VTVENFPDCGKRAIYPLGSDKNWDRHLSANISKDRENKSRQLIGLLLISVCFCFYSCCAILREFCWQRLSLVFTHFLWASVGWLFWSILASRVFAECWCLIVLFVDAGNYGQLMRFLKIDTIQCLRLVYVGIVKSNGRPNKPWEMALPRAGETDRLKPIFDDFSNSPTIWRLISDYFFQAGGTGGRDLAGELFWWKR